MKSVGFFGKVFGGLIAAIVITAFGVYAAALPILVQSLEREAADQVQRDAARARDFALASTDPERDELDTAALKRGSGLATESKATFLDPDGRVLFDPTGERSSKTDLGGVTEVRAPSKVVTRLDEATGRETTYCALRIERDGELLGYARAEAPIELPDERLSQLRRAIQSGALIATLLSFFLAWFFARTLTRPLSEIGLLISEIGEERTLRRLRLNRQDELGSLALAVNDMADNLERQVARVDRDRKEREAIFTALAAGLLAVDSEQNVLFVNEQACQLLGMEEGRLKGKPVWELTRISALVETLDACLESGKRTRGEARIPTEEGEFVVELTAVPLAGAEGAAPGCVVELRDVSELRRLEAMRSDFVTNVSHELKTPLTAMRGYTEAVLEDPDMPAALQRSFLEKARTNTERLVAIVADLLSLARLESAGHGLEFDRVSVEDLARAVLEDVRDLAESRQATLEFEAPDGSLEAQADDQALSMALSNLVSNAIHYSPEGSTVRVAIRKRGSKVVLEVSDEGPGIPKHEQERIFERFYRVDKARSRKLGGTGLGLAIVRHVMFAHQGSVEVESHVGRGSCFRLVLPAA